MDVKPKEVLDMEERMYGQETSIDGPADSDDDDRFSPSDWLTRTSDQPEAILEAEDRQHLEGEGLQTALAALDPRSRHCKTGNTAGACSRTWRFCRTRASD